MQHQYAADVVKALIEPFDALAADHDFWNHTLDGLAVLGAPGLFKVFQLQRPLAELAVAADSFHTKPLRRWLQTTGRYQVLALSRHHVQLFEGNRNELDAVPLGASEPHTMGGAVGDEIDGDAERFFRAVDRAVQEHHSQPSGLPLMLAALPEHHHLFRQVSHNRLLLADGLMVDPQGLSPETLCQRAWAVVAPQQEAQQMAWRDACAAASANGMGSDDLSVIAHAAVAGRVASLLIEAERELPGRIDPSTGRIDAAAIDSPRVDDLLDDLGGLVESMGGEVHVMAADRMPSQTGAIARFRH